MKTVTFNIEDDLFAKIAGVARQAGVAEQDTVE